MCGIAGVQLRKPLGTTEVEKLVASFERSLHRRGPDGSGFQLSGSTLLFSSRLAIVDVPHGWQPFSPGNGLILIANGEIYNSPELRQQYNDYPYETGSDCETILPLYEAHGTKFIEYLRGMFAIAIYDAKSDELVLARDPFGIKPLYYSETEDGFAFASTLEALIEPGLATRKLGDGATEELLQLKYNTGERTIFRDIRRLEPGTVLTVKDGCIAASRCNSTWPRNAAAFKSASIQAVSKPELLKSFDTAICNSVDVHMRSDAPLCFFFSGGLDSTILLSAAKKVTDRGLNAFTVGYEGDESVDESGIALRFALGLGVACHRVEVSSGYFWDRMPELVQAIDDPMADIAALPLFALGEAAFTRGYKVALTGEGADEVFGGYSRYRRATLPWFLRSKRSRRGVFTNSGISNGRFNGWSEGIDKLEREQSPFWKSRLQLLQGIDVLERLPNCLLIKLDRSLMAHSVEGRTPFLDKEVLAFASSVPDRFKATPRVVKPLLRDWLAQEYPQADPYARKRGFKAPVSEWILERENELVPLIAAQPAIADIFTLSEIATIVSEADKREQPAWSVLFYALWHSIHVLGVSSDGDIADTLQRASC